MKYLELTLHKPRDKVETLVLWLSADINTEYDSKNTFLMLSLYDKISIIVL